MLLASELKVMVWPDRVVTKMCKPPSQPQITRLQDSQILSRQCRQLKHLKDQKKQLKEHTKNPRQTAAARQAIQQSISMYGSRFAPRHLLL